MGRGAAGEVMMSPGIPTARLLAVSPVQCSRSRSGSRSLGAAGWK